MKVGQLRFERRKKEGVAPSMLTCSTLLDAYSKGGFHMETPNVVTEFT